MKRRNFISSVVSGAALAPMACGAVEKSEIKNLSGTRKLMSSLSDTGAGAAAAIEATDNGAKSSFLKRCRLGVVTLQSPGRNHYPQERFRCPKIL